MQEIETPVVPQQSAEELVRINSMSSNGSTPFTSSPHQTPNFSPFPSGSVQQQYGGYNQGGFGGYNQGMNQAMYQQTNYPMQHTINRSESNATNGTNVTNTTNNDQMMPPPITSRTPQGAPGSNGYIDNDYKEDQLENGDDDEYEYYDDDEDDDLNAMYDENPDNSDNDENYGAMYETPGNNAPKKTAGY